MVTDRRHRTRTHDGSRPGPPRHPRSGRAAPSARGMGVGRPTAVGRGRGGRAYGCGARSPVVRRGATRRPGAARAATPPPPSAASPETSAPTRREPAPPLPASTRSPATPRWPTPSARGRDGRAADARARWPRSSARPRRASTPGWPTPTRPCCAPTTATGTAIDEVEFHPSWHWLMQHLRRLGTARHALGRRARVRRARRAGRGVLPDEPARGGPLLPDLDDLRGRPRAAARPGARRAVRARAAGPALRPRPRRRRTSKAGLLAGMSMTEKQGGSDVRAGTTARRARPPDGTLPARSGTSGSPRRR